MSESRTEGVVLGPLPRGVPVMDVPMYSDNELRTAIAKAIDKERTRISAGVTNLRRELWSGNGYMWPDEMAALINETERPKRG